MTRWSHFCYLFIIVLKVVFRIIKETSITEGFEIFQEKFIYTAYAGYTTFFLKSTKSVINLLEILSIFHIFPVSNQTNQNAK